MLKKVLWCLLALLAALVGIYGVVRLGWTWELFVVAGSVAFCLVAAVLTPEKSVEQELEEAYDSVGAEEPVPAPAALPASAESLDFEESRESEDLPVVEVTETGEVLRSPAPQPSRASEAGPLLARITRRFTWDEVSQACEADGPTGF